VISVSSPTPTPTPTPTGPTPTPGPIAAPTASPTPRPTGRTGRGVGLLSRAADGTVLDVWFPRPYLAGLQDPIEADRLERAELTPLALTDDVRRVSREVVTVESDLDSAPRDTADVYLRLHLLSHRLIAPHGADLTGWPGLLATVVWTDGGPCAVEGFEQTRLRLLALKRDVRVLSVDKFPRLVDYLIPSGVRIADADRVRLGAHLAPGTTVMHEGFVNFDAGTLGAVMVEGRISAGVTVGEGSDIGGGASIMGTLSGGGTEVVSIGRRTLLGANAGLGIALGDDCVVEAGLYLTAGTKLALPDGRVVRARELSGADGLTFRRNSMSGAVEALPTVASGAVTLNAALHTAQ